MKSIDDIVKAAVLAVYPNAKAAAEDPGCTTHQVAVKAIELWAGENQGEAFKQIFDKIMSEAGTVSERTQQYIDNSWEGAKNDRLHFALECAGQYGFAIIDEDGDYYGVTAGRLADLMSALGYRAPGEKSPFGSFSLERERSAASKALVAFGRAAGGDPDLMTDYTVRKMPEFKAVENAMHTLLGKLHAAATIELQKQRINSTIKVDTTTMAEGLKRIADKVDGIRYDIRGSGAPLDPDVAARITATAQEYLRNLMARPEIKSMFGDGGESVDTEQDGIDLAQPRNSHNQLMRVNKGYDVLASILVEALNQAQDGKGHERHNLADDTPFERQRMQTVSELIGSVHGMTYQVCKKVTEGVNLPTLDRQVAELLGAINYLAGMVIFLRKHRARPTAAEKVALNERFGKLGDVQPSRPSHVATMPVGLSPDDQVMIHRKGQTIIGPLRAGDVEWDSVLGYEPVPVETPIGGEAWGGPGAVIKPEAIGKSAGCAGGCSGCAAAPPAADTGTPHHPV